MFNCPSKTSSEWTNLVRSQGEETAYNLWFLYDGIVPSEYYNDVSEPVNKLKTNLNYQISSTEGQTSSEKTIRDLAARISHRIGIPYRFESDRTKEYKGKLENGTAYINLAYATLDTPIHEILGHPIIRAIKNKGLQKPKIINDVDTFFTLDGSEYVFEKNTNEYFKDGEEISKQEFDNAVKKVEQLNNQSSQLYQNLLKELEYGKGKEVLDRIKRDYNIKNISKNYNIIDKSKNTDLEIIQNFGNYWFKEYNEVFSRGKQFNTNEELKSLIEKEQNKQKYTLEEQQEEAIVELLGLMTAQKLDAVKDGKLISLLKRLLKEMKEFIRSLINQKEIEIDKLPDNMTIEDLSNLLAYSNSKLILPGYEVEYTTPDNMKFKTYQEASNHISQLAKSVKDVDLSDTSLERKLSKEDLQKIEELENQKKEKEDYFDSKKYQQDKDFELYELNKKLEELKNKKVEFYSQEPFLDLEDKEKYGFQDFDYIRVESTYGRGNEYHKDILGENYEGYYIHGYNTSKGKPKKKILPITKEQAIKIWEKDESSKYEVGDKREIFRTEDSIRYLQEDSKIKYEISSIEEDIKNIKVGQNTIQNFIEKNKEYEQSKEIIEEWKKVNNIQYNPEEIYSRGQGFYSSLGAYAPEIDGELLLQNLLQHIEDNEKADGEYVISAFTKPIDKTVRHIEKSGINYVIFPSSEDIKWAAGTDVHSGSTWDAHEKVSKGTKKELTGVSYTKAPRLSNINEIEPNLANIIDNLHWDHNELGIRLRGNNFRLEINKEVLNETDGQEYYKMQALVNKINSILDQKYGKLVKPETSTNYKWIVFSETSDEGDTAFKDPYRGFVAEFDTKEEADNFAKSQYPSDLHYVKRGNSKGISPKITKNTLTESIESVKDKTLGIIRTQRNLDREELLDKGYKELDYGELYKPKEYTDQALINTKIATLKEIAKKYPRSLIRSDVKPINNIINSDTDWQKINIEIKNNTKINGNKLLNTSYPKDISKQQLFNLRKKLSELNNNNFKNDINKTYKLKVKQLGQSEMFTWELEELPGKLNMNKKIERLSNADKLNSPFIEKLQNLNSSNQLSLFLENHAADLESGKIIIKC